MDNVLGVRTHKEMVDVLMSPTSPGPEIHYYMIRGGSEKGNITVWESGTVGEEYIKTYGHYHISDFIEIYKVLSGEGILILQERKLDESGNPVDDEVEYVKAIFIKEGSVIEIPKRAGHLAVNTGGKWLVTEDNSPVHTGNDKSAWPVHADYAPVKKLGGFAYFVVERNGKPDFVKNPNYKNIPEIIIEEL